MAHPSSSNSVRGGKMQQETCRRRSGAWSSVKGDRDEVVWCVQSAARGVRGWQNAARKVCGEGRILVSAIGVRGWQNVARDVRKTEKVQRSMSSDVQQHKHSKRNARQCKRSKAGQLTVV